MIGSGKTTIGMRLADILLRDFYDLDQEMNRMLGYSFHKLVREKGWVPFRELEYAICKRFAKLKHAVIALGGGTVRYEWNLDALRGTGPIVLLETSLPDIIERVRKADRPRVNIGVTLEEDVHTIWEEFKSKYYAAADIIYQTSGKSIEQETAELKGILSYYLKH
jgi:shikimate kinase